MSIFSLSLCFHDEQVPSWNNSSKNSHFRTEADILRRVVLMAHPFTVVGSHPTVRPSAHPIRLDPVEDQSITLARNLAALPKPVKFYKYYYTEAVANGEMSYPIGVSLHKFLRGYFYLKSANWKGNASIGPLMSAAPMHLATMPPYYMMPIDHGMRATIAEDMDGLDHEEVARNLARWLPESDIAVYAAEFGRTGFQGGLNWYRVGASPELAREADSLAGKKLEVPCCFVVGDRDWARFQTPGAVDEMVTGKSCEQFRGVKLIKGAGHWAMQERPEEVVHEILAFMKGEGVEGGRSEWG